MYEDIEGEIGTRGLVLDGPDRIYRVDSGDFTSARLDFRHPTACAGAELVNDCLWSETGDIEAYGTFSTDQIIGAFGAKRQ